MLSKSKCGMISFSIKPRSCTGLTLSELLLNVVIFCSVVWMILTGSVGVNDDLFRGSCAGPLYAKDQDDTSKRDKKVNSAELLNLVFFIFNRIMYIPVLSVLAVRNIL
jgi:hypothetical protein